jgi:serralysin
LDSDIFTGLAVGTLSADAFHIGASAADGSDRIIYNDDTGALYFDLDGNGTGASQVQFATLLGTPDLTRFDLVVI